MRNAERKGKRMSDLIQWPSKSKRLVIEVCRIDEPGFICGVSGKMCLVVMDEIEKQLAENEAEDGELEHGTYLYEVTRFKGQYDHEGRCELDPYWELTQIGFEPINRKGGKHE